MNRIDQALATFEQAIKKDPPKPLVVEHHPVFPPIPTGPESFEELKRKLTLENQLADAVPCAKCGHARLDHLTTIPTPVAPSVALICPGSPTYEPKAS